MFYIISYIKEIKISYIRDRLKSHLSEISFLFILFILSFKLSKYDNKWDVYFYSSFLISNMMLHYFLAFIVLITFIILYWWMSPSHAPPISISILHSWYQTWCYIIFKFLSPSLFYIDGCHHHMHHQFNK